METKLYVGNLPFSAKENELKEYFSQAGEVTDVAIINDRRSGRSKGFAFVTMSSKEQLETAIQMLNDKDFGGRPLKVSIARPREEGKNRPKGGGRDRRGEGRRDSRGSRNRDRKENTREDY